MESRTATTQDKQITIDVPEDRVAEFYAFYARFLAVRGGRRGGRRGHGRGHGHGHGHGGHAKHRFEPAADEVQAV